MTNSCMFLYPLLAFSSNGYHLLWSNGARRFFRVRFFWLLVQYYRPPTRTISVLHIRTSGVRRIYTNLSIKKRRLNISSLLLATVTQISDWSERRFSDLINHRFSRVFSVSQIWLISDFYFLFFTVCVSHTNSAFCTVQLSFSTHIVKVVNSKLEIGFESGRRKNSPSLSINGFWHLVTYCSFISQKTH